MHRGQAKLNHKLAEFRVRMQPAKLRSDFHGGKPQVVTLARHCNEFHRLIPLAQVALGGGNF
jgi:hypothetical protein